MRRPTTKKRLAMRKPPSSQPTAPRSATKPPRKSQAFAMFRAAWNAGRITRARPPRCSRLVVRAGLGVGEPARGPVRLRGVAPAGAMERRDVLERDQDVTVQ